MISDEEIQTAAAIKNLQRKIHRAVKNESVKNDDEETFDEESFIENYLELVELNPDLFEIFESLCEFFNQFQISVGVATNHD